MTIFKPNRNLTRQLADEPEMRARLRDAADDIAAMAGQLAPDGGPHRGVRETYRAVSDADGVRAETTDPFGHLVEFGSAKNPPYAPLRRAVRAVGLRLDEHPKT